MSCHIPGATIHRTRSSSSSPYHSPRHSPQHLPYYSPHRSPPSPSRRSRSFERRPSPSSHGRQREEISAERLAKKLLQSSATHSISDPSSLDEMVQTLTPALLSELARMKSSSSSPSSSKGSKCSSTRPLKGQKRSSLATKATSSLTSQDVSFKKPKNEKNPITSHSSTSKYCPTKSNTTTRAPDPPTTTSAEKRYHGTGLLPTPKIEPLLSTPKPLLPIHITKPLLRNYKGTKAKGLTTTSTAKVLVSKAKAAALKQTKTQQQGKKLVKVAAKKAAVKGSVSKAKTMRTIVKKPQPKQTKSQVSAETTKVKVDETTATESEAKPDDSSITLVAVKGSVSKAKTNVKKPKQSKTAVSKRPRPTKSGPKEGSKPKDVKIIPENQANRTNYGQPKPDDSRCKTNENQPKSKDAPPKSRDPTLTPLDTSTTVAQPEAAPKDATNPAKDAVETAVQHSSTSSKASNGASMAAAATAQHLRFRHPESMRVEGLDNDQMRSRFDIMGYTKMAMITNLPDWDTDEAYTQLEVAMLLKPYGYIHRKDSLYILPHQRMAFFQMPYWKDLVELMRADSSKPHRLRGSTLIFHIVMEPLNFSLEAAYTYLMGLSNGPAVDTATLKERLVIISSEVMCYPRSSQEIWEAVTAAARVRNYLPLLDRVYVEFESVEDMNAVLRWSTENAFFERYNIHLFKPAHLTATALDRPEISSTRGRHAERSSSERSDSSMQGRRANLEMRDSFRSRRRASSSPERRDSFRSRRRASSSPERRDSFRSRRRASPERADFFRSRRDSFRHRRRSSSSGSSPSPHRSRHNESPTASRRRMESSSARGHHGERSSPGRRESSRHRRRSSSSGSSPSPRRSRHNESPAAHRRRESPGSRGRYGERSRRRRASSSPERRDSYRGRRRDSSSPDRRDSFRNRRRSSSSESSHSPNWNTQNESPTANRRRREENARQGPGFATTFIDDNPSEACPFSMDDLNWEEMVTVDEVGDVGDKSSRLPCSSSPSSSDRRRSSRIPSTPERSSKRARTEDGSSSSSADKRSGKESSPKTRSPSSYPKTVESSQDSSEKRQPEALTEAQIRALHFLKNVMLTGAVELTTGPEGSDDGFPVTSQNLDSDLSTKTTEGEVATSDHKSSADTTAEKASESEAEMETSVTQPQVEEGVEGTNQAHGDSPSRGKDGQSGASPSPDPGAAEDDLQKDVKAQQKKSTKAARKTPAKKSSSITQRRKTRSSVVSTDTTSGTTATNEATDDTDASRPMDEVVDEQVHVAAPITEGAVETSDHKVSAEAAAVESADSEVEMETSVTQPQVEEGVEGTNQAQRHSPPQGKDGQSGASPSLEPDATEDDLQTDVKKCTEYGDETPEDDEGQEDNYEILNSREDREGTTIKDGHLVDQETTESEKRMETSVAQPQVPENEEVEDANQAQGDSPPQGKDGQSGASPSPEPGAAEDDLQKDVKTQQKKSTKAARKTPAKKSPSVTQRRKTRSSAVSTDTTSGTTATNEATDDTDASRPMEEAVTEQVHVAAPMTEGAVETSDHKVSAEASEVKSAE